MRSVVNGKDKGCTMCKVRLAPAVDFKPFDPCLLRYQIVVRAPRNDGMLSRLARDEVDGLLAWAHLAAALIDETRFLDMTRRMW